MRRLTNPTARGINSVRIADRARFGERCTDFDHPRLRENPEGAVDLPLL
jgi:hypothetical protein